METKLEKTRRPSNKLIRMMIIHKLNAVVVVVVFIVIIIMDALGHGAGDRMRG